MSDETFVERDYVYQGERIGNGNVRIVSLGVLDNGVIIRNFCLKWSKEWKIKAVGCIYAGATFSESQVKGATQAKFKEQWPNSDDRIEWLAKQAEATDEQERLKLDKKLAGSNDIDKALAPLRRVYWKLTPSQREAMQRAVIRSLCKLPDR